MSNSKDATQSKHEKATRSFWAVLLGATIMSLVGNVVFVSTVGRGRINGCWRYPADTSGR